MKLDNKKTRVRVLELAKFLPVFHQLAVDAPSLRKLSFKRAVLSIMPDECLCVVSACTVSVEHVAMTTSDYWVSSFRIVQ